RLGTGDWGLATGDWAASSAIFIYVYYLQSEQRRLGVKHQATRIPIYNLQSYWIPLAHWMEMLYYSRSDRNPYAEAHRRGDCCDWRRRNRATGGGPAGEFGAADHPAGAAGGGSGDRAAAAARAA